MARVIARIALGEDRRRVRYWRLANCNQRIFVENCDNGEWGFYDSVEELNDLLNFLDTRGVRENRLHATLSTIDWEIKPM